MIKEAVATQVTFPNVDAATSDVLNEVKKSTQILCFTARGDSVETIIKKCIDGKGIDSTNKLVVILSDKNNPALIERVNSLGNNVSLPDYKKTIETLANAIELKVKEGVTGHSNFKCAYHNEPIVFMFVLLDNCVYWAYFEENVFCFNSNLYKSDKSSPIYVAFKKYFEAVYAKTGVTPIGTGEMVLPPKII
jgi:hypothetical protein